MIEEFFKSENEKINAELEGFFITQAKSVNDVLLTDFTDQLKEFVINKKAKRIHPIILISAFSGIINPLYLDEQINDIRKVSIAMELLHSGHLIHDDLIDDDLERRGKPTFHIQLKNNLKDVYKNIDLPSKQQRITNYGRDMSILGGSLGYLLGLSVLKDSKFPDKQKLSAINEYSEAMDYLIKGQIIEEYMEYHNITQSMEQYLSIAEMQRARLFEKSVNIGAILARGNKHYQIKPLSDAMLKIGQAHAIRDDILDVKEDIIGKRKKFIYILGVQNTDEEQSKIINDIYRKEKVSKADVKAVMDIFSDTNALIIAEHFSKNLIAQAKNNLKEIYPDLNREQKVFFNEFSDFIYLREM